MATNSDDTFRQPPPDEAPPYHEAILMGAPVIGKKREAAPITSVNTLKPVYRRKFNGKLSILVLALVLISAAAVFAASFVSPKKPPITSSIRNQRRESRSERERSRAAVNYGVTPAPMPSAKVDKQTGTDFHFDEPQNGAAVNSADERPVRNNPPMAHVQSEIAMECRRSSTSAPVDQWPSRTRTFDTETSLNNPLNRLNSFSSDTASGFNFVNMADIHPEPAQSPQTLAPQPDISSESTQVHTISFSSSSSSSVQSYEMDLPMFYPLPFANLSDEGEGEDTDSSGSSSSSSESEEISDHQRNEFEQMRSHDRRI